MTTIEQANETALALAADDFGEMFGGAFVVRALDGSGYAAMWGNPEMSGPVTAFIDGRHRPAGIIAFFAHASQS